MRSPVSEFDLDIRVLALAQEPEFEPEARTRRQTCAATCPATCADTCPATCSGCGGGGGGGHHTPTVSCDPAACHPPPRGG